MSRPIKTVKLSACEVDIVTYITWGEKEKIQNSIVKGAKIDGSGVSGFDASVISESKYQLLELAVKEIREGDAKIPFTREWMDNLSVEDGDALFDAVDALNKKKD